MENLKIFIAGQGFFTGRKFLKEKIDEIDKLHQMAYKLNEEGLGKRKILSKMFGGESYLASFTNGELSCENLLDSLLEWPLHNHL